MCHTFHCTVQGGATYMELYSTFSGSYQNYQHFIMLYISQVTLQTYHTLIGIVIFHVNRMYGIHIWNSLILEMCKQLPHWWSSTLPVKMPTVSEDTKFTILALYNEGLQLKVMHTRLNGEASRSTIFMVIDKKKTRAVAERWPKRNANAEGSQNCQEYLFCTEQSYQKNS